ncbi:hypothetical protein Zm00014a_031047 [Zea mays]|uniref:Uncharacterized protein n=1 Tax=Zea mays TaxID=4577 RepID=A0A3L6EFR5_MAIZE|nr:hypothetical protein Zm00014a_031047 [Zea mays]
MHTRDTHRLNPLCLTTLNHSELLNLFPVFTVAVVGLSQVHNNPIKACSRFVSGQ